MILIIAFLVSLGTFVVVWGICVVYLGDKYRILCKDICLDAISIWASAHSAKLDKQQREEGLAIAQASAHLQLRNNRRMLLEQIYTE